MEWILWIVSSYLAFSVAYYALFALSAYLYCPPKLNLDCPPQRIAVLIPAYREDGVIVDTVRNVLEQNYPRSQYDVVVIGDSLQEQTLRTLRLLPIYLLEPSFEKSSKVNALNYAMEVLTDDYEMALILDADNHLEPDFLKKVNAYYGPQNPVIQAHRTAKNQQYLLCPPGCYQ
ncbi:MAG: glycosyltransferase family 2 protein [Bacteroidia bacterium]|nr:glycosyltransferase family 2 protein [Bacteroidia bacterium]